MRYLITITTARESFPFLLEGKAGKIDWHVISRDPNDKIHTHEKHKNSGLHRTLLAESVRIVGFYSKNHQGIFTHHTSNIHMHFITDDKRLTGHIDALKIMKAIKLSVPKTAV